jgi:hypothetical protein
MNFQSLPLNDLVALLSLGIALYSMRRTLKAEKQMKQLTELSLRFSEKSTEREWATRGCDALVEAFHLMECPKPREDDRLLDLRIRLSSLIDQGRWLFPNEADTEYGQSKNAAYRGFRRQVLTHLVRVYQALETTHPGPDVQKAIDHHKRAFVTEVQTILDTRVRERHLHTLAPAVGKPAPSPI